MPFRHQMLITTLLLLTFLLTANIFAVPPSPEAIEQWRAEGILEQKLIEWRLVDRVDSYLSAKENWAAEKLRSSTSLAGDVDTLYVVVSLVDFSDMEHTEGAGEFDSLLFSVKGAGVYNNPTGSMTDFYYENSYGKVLVIGHISGWHRMPEPYSYYVGTDNGFKKSPELAELAALATDVEVDYQAISKGGTFLGFIVVHAGGGAETGAVGIWSHARKDFAVMMDDVLISRFTMNPEKYGTSTNISTMGVFAHEYGHALGLPDLYDTDPTHTESSGLGQWSMMASGSWNRINRGGDSPAHFDAWCKVELGYVETIDIFWNTDGAISPPTAITNAHIPQVESEPVIYKIWNDADDMKAEYWLVENRQQVGFDVGLPGNGLCVYHIDSWKTNNNLPGQYMVGLEQADGTNELAFSGSLGDKDDPFPGGTNNREFGTLTSPNSLTHDGQVSRVGIWDISDSDSLMFANLEAGYTRPNPILIGTDSILFSDAKAISDDNNGNGIFEPGETIEFRCRIKNTMAQTFDPRIILSSDNPALSFSPSYVSLGISLNPVLTYNSDPIKFTIPEGSNPSNVTFTLTLESDDECCYTYENTYTTTWAIEQVLGQPPILIVDNDGGLGFDLPYRKAINNLNHAWGIWDISKQGSPVIDDLIPYEIVIYMSGHPDTDGVLTMSEVNAFSGYMDYGGNFAIVSASATSQLNAIAPAFLSNYMHVNIDNNPNNYGTSVEGVDGSTFGNGLRFWYDGSLKPSFSGAHEMVLPIAPAEVGYKVSFFGNLNGVCGAAYSGPGYKSIILTAPLEFYDNNYAGYNTSTDMMQAINHFFGVMTDVAESKSDVLPTGFALAQNYPNPFNPSTTISYTVPYGANGKAVNTSLQIFNVMGQNVKTLVDKPQFPGTYTVDWDGRNEAGNRTSSGVYIYRLITGSESTTKKMVMIK